MAQPHEQGHHHHCDDGGHHHYHGCNILAKIAAAAAMDAQGR
ncbi:MAG: hypothetical protein OXG49_09105 [Chloroflexi bacterium]|nr:hypothetical protein [Chloroflexota bacterium]